jgi:hypothetical protein
MGNSEQGGLYAVTEASMTGFAMSVDKNGFERGTCIAITTSLVSKIPYPISVVADANAVYVVSLTTTNDALSDEFNTAVTSAFPNWIQYQKYGSSSLEMTVSRMTLSQPTFLGVPDGASPLGDRPFLDRMDSRNDCGAAKLRKKKEQNNRMPFSKSASLVSD